MRDVISLNLPIRFDEEDEVELGSLLEDPGPGPEEICLQNARRESLEKYMKKYLDERQIMILRLRYGFEDGHCYTLECVAKKLGLTGERVRQLEYKAMKKLRLKFMTKGLTAEDI